MSGRDYKIFVNSHRGSSAEAAKLVGRITDGIKSNKYKPVDYDQLKALTAEKKFQGHVKLSKLRKFEQISKHNKEQNLLKQHHLVWKKEFLKLNNQRKKLQTEIDNILRLGDGPSEHLFEHLGDYEFELGEQFNKFRLQTVEPIWNLREDLQYWVVNHQQGLDEKGLQEHAEVSVILENVKEQQARVLEQLQHEQQALEQELQAAGLPELHGYKYHDVETGIPAEAYDQECPSDDLKVKVLQEFIILDQRYQDRLQELAHQHPDAIQSDQPHGSWTEEDHFVFVAVSDQYPSDMTNRRLHFLDRIKMHLPHKSKAAVIAHEQWWLQYKYYHDRHKAIRHDWIRDRKELFQKTKAIFAEACIEGEIQDVKSKHKDMQEELCQILYDQVEKWRAQKWEAMQLEEQLLARKLEEEQEQEQIIHERETKRRNKDKDQISAYKDEHAEQQRVAAEVAQRRLEQLRAMMEEQAQYDKERVIYREEQQALKLEEKQRAKEEAEQQEEAQQERLEALREQVRPHVEADPARVAQQTQAWYNRQVAEDEIVIQKPLFETHSFTAKQINSDARVRLENKLREAGLHNTDYARQMMKHVAPPSLPRPDMDSTLFKQTQQ